MDGVVGLMCGSDQELGIEDRLVAARNVLDDHRVHVVDVEATMNVESFDAQITTLISDDDVAANVSPLGRGVELLVHPSVEPEGGLTDLAVKCEVLEAVLEGGDAAEL